MRVFRVSRIEKMGTVAVYTGVVEGQRLIVGDEVFLVSSDGERDEAHIAAIIPDYQGDREFDVGPVGKRVKITCRRRAPTFVDDDVVGFEKAEIV